MWQDVDNSLLRNISHQTTIPWDNYREEITIKPVCLLCRFDFWDEHQSQRHFFMFLVSFPFIPEKILDVQKDLYITVGSIGKSDFTDFWQKDEFSNFWDGTIYSVYIKSIWFAGRRNLFKPLVSPGRSGTRLALPWSDLKWLHRAVFIPIHFKWKVSGAERMHAAWGRSTHGGKIMTQHYIVTTLLSSL